MYKFPRIRARIYNKSDRKVIEYGVREDRLFGWLAFVD